MKEIIISQGKKKREVVEIIGEIKGKRKSTTYHQMLINGKWVDTPEHHRSIRTGKR
jgi:hypothetical protein